jgi:hypothetical protein
MRCQDEESTSILKELHSVYVIVFGYLLLRNAQTNMNALSMKWRAERTEIL